MIDWILFYAVSAIFHYTAGEVIQAPHLPVDKIQRGKTIVSHSVSFVKN